MTASYDPDLLGGVVALDADGLASDVAAWDGSLYRPTDDVEWTDVDVRAIPYYAWDNRDPGAMTVWIESA